MSKIEELEKRIAEVLGVDVEVVRKVGILCLADHLGPWALESGGLALGVEDEQLDKWIEEASG